VKLADLKYLWLLSETSHQLIMLYETALDKNKSSVKSFFAEKLVKTLHVKIRKTSEIHTNKRLGIILKISYIRKNFSFARKNKSDKVITAMLRFEF
jgi:hypothetical protein